MNAAFKLLPGEGTTITSLTTTSQASGALPVGTTRSYLVRVTGVAAHVRSGSSAAGTTALSDGTDLYLADGDSAVVHLSNAEHDEIAAIADDGSDGTVHIYPVVFVGT